MNWSVLSMCQRLALVPTLMLLLLCHSSANAQDECTYIHHKADPKAKPLLQLLVGYRFSGKDDSGAYEYLLGICTKASLDKTGGGYDEAGIVQVDMNDDKKTHIVGKFTQAELMSGTDWLMLEYEGGDNYTSHCGTERRRAIIMIACDPSIISIGDVKVRVLDEENTKKSDCYYMFELGHHSVCKEPSAVTFSLSVGSIVVIVFISVCGLYLLLGFLYNRFVLSAKGMEQIPNYSFWKDFGNLQADGCNFICRTGRGQEPRSYKGIGDDQLQEDDERDDHLLPM